MIEATVIEEDPRYPLIVVTGDIRLGIYLTGGKLRPVCICSAREPDECICDYAQFMGAE